MPTRTAVLARGLSAGGISPTILLTVPAGETYIVKEVDMLNGSGVAVTVFIQAQDPTNMLIGRVFAKSIATGAIDSWSGWIVLGPGDSLAGYAAQNGIYYWVSGTKLTGVA